MEQLNQALGAERDRTYRYLEEAGVMMVVLDTAGRVEYLNRKACEMVGRDRDELTGRHWFEEILPESMVGHAGEIFRLLAGSDGDEPTVYIEAALQRADGAERRVAWYNTVARNDDGTPRWLGLSGVDVTEQHDAEQKLRHSRIQEEILNRLLRIGLRRASLHEKLTECLEQILTVPWIALHPRGGIFLAREHDQVLELFVHKDLPAQLQSMCAQVAYGHCLCGRAAQQRQMIFSDRVDHRHENHYPEMDPHGHYVMPMLSGERLLGVIVLYLDETHPAAAEEQAFLTAAANTVAGILERARAEDALRSSEQRLRTIVEYEANGILVLDQEGRVLFANPAATDMLGMNAEEMMGDLLPVAGEADQALELIDHDGAPRQAEVSEVATYWDGQPARLVVLHDVTERRHYEVELRHQASHDALTGLPNRSLLGDRLDQAVAYARRHGVRLAVLFVDLDQFKLVNDSLGHDAGDSLLQALAERLQGACREGDTVARIGGDEFVLLASEVGEPNDVVGLANRICKQLATPVEVAGRELTVTSSLGIALFPADGEEGETLLRNADAAMYRAKEVGRNTFQFYTREINQDVTDRLTLAQELRRALEADELFLVYQPQVDLATGRVVGVEALVRWQHPEQGLVMPNRFIPVAEESGLIVPLGKWVLETACRQGAAWRAAGLAPITIAVNASDKQFDQGRLDEVVRDTLERTGLPAAALEIELTERVMMRGGAAQHAALGILREEGVRIAVDDFGTGYSNLAQLQNFALDRLKIERSFVRNLDSGPDEPAIVLAMVSMARALGLEVIAEGVETEAQARFLTDKGCPQGQGFFFARPLPAAEVATLLAAGESLLPQRPPEEATRVLVVDHDREMALALQRSLTRAGYQVTVATDIIEGFEHLTLTPFEVAVVDQGMPEESGIRFLSRMRSLYPEIGRIVISAYRDFDKVIAAFNDGTIEHFVAKPWEERELVQAIEKVEAMRRD